jgi:signal transduction histidine kinase
LADHLDERRLRRLIAVGRGLLAQLDPEAVLERVLETAREVTGARYAALGILDRDRHELERFIQQGVDEETQRAIGDLPRGRGLLGMLVDDPQAVRVATVGEHPKSYGFPPGHPPMASFLGVPILVRGRIWGNLYLTEKDGGEEFDAADEESVEILAGWAAIAIENSRLYEAAAVRRDELEQSARRLEASRAIAVAVGAEMELENVLELIAKRGRALVAARSLVILLREGDDLVVAASAGVTDRAATGMRVPVAASTTGEVLESRTVQRIADADAQLRISAAQLGAPGAKTALLAPLVYRGRGLGVLAAFDRGSEAAGFTADDEMTLRAFAASAATAVALAQTVQQDRLRHSLDAAEAERRRWARELHDETLQGLGGLRVLLSSTLRRLEPGDAADLLREGVGEVEREIENLRAIITELRPAALDELGLAPAIEALVARVSAVEGLTVDADLDVERDGRMLGPELETTVYRLVQEALTNVAKHARAVHARVGVTLASGRVEVEISDDGAGFDPTVARSGFGLAGMRERVELSGGQLEITPSVAGTTVRAVIPLPADNGNAAAQRIGA